LYTKGVILNLSIEKIGGNENEIKKLVQCGDFINRLSINIERAFY
jgi:hypothetical protein